MNEQSDDAHHEALATLRAAPAPLNESHGDVLNAVAYVLSNPAALRTRLAMERLTGAALIAAVCANRDHAIGFARVSVCAGELATILRELANVIEQSGTRVLLALQARDDADSVIAEAITANANAGADTKFAPLGADNHLYG